MIFFGYLLKSIHKLFITKKIIQKVENMKMKMWKCENVKIWNWKCEKCEKKCEFEFPLNIIIN